MEDEKEKKKDQVTSSSSSTSCFIDRFIEKLPEIHVIGYSYCGPNTDLAKRLAQGVEGVNELDCACKEHDIAYAENKDLKIRYNADKKLFLKAFIRIYVKDSRIGERFIIILVLF